MEILPFAPADAHYLSVDDIAVSQRYLAIVVNAVLNVFLRIADNVVLENAIDAAAS